ncbi:hypothetical protein M3Y94_00747700 [Aphelenchoides besseyi]|nr:hypothetical protein M3Y94_00747700 [Aphelenchoides besseyi]
MRQSNNARFLAVRAINLVDSTKVGFRVMLRDEFLKEHLAPNFLPTLYISAIPLKHDERTISKVFYPDNVSDDKQITITDLRERSWYYLCVEWENFNRHNETTGTDCRIHRTLDRFGKGAESTLTDIDAADVSAQMFSFRVRSAADFPIRLTASLQGGEATAAAQVFQLNEPAELEIVFPFLRQDKDYGRLCVLEEPLVSGFTAMGRQISGLSLFNCYFKGLRTKDYELSVSVSEASPYVRSETSDTRSRLSLISLVLIVVTSLYCR